MDIGEAFFSSKRTRAFSGEPLDSPQETVLPHSLAEFRGHCQSHESRLCAPPAGAGFGPPPVSGFLLGLQNLPTLVHAGLQIEVVRTAQFAGILVLGIGRLLQGIRRAAHATTRRRCFSSGNGHNGPLGVLSEASSETGRPSASRTGCDADK